MDSSPLTDGLRSRLPSSSPPSPTCTETDLPMDIDRSFGSNMSISGGEPFEFSPCRPTASGSGATLGADLTNSASFASGSGYLSPTSPAPRSKVAPRRPALSPLQSNRQTQASLPSFALPKRAMTADIQPFGFQPLKPTSSFGLDDKAVMPPPAIPERRMLKVRAPIPTTWASSGEGKENASGSGSSLFGGLGAKASLSPKNASFASSSSMDVDSPAPTTRRPTIAASPSFSGSASLDSSPGFGAYFEASPAPALIANPTKRRSLLEDSPSASGSPSAKRASFGKKADKCASSSAMLFGTTRVNTLASRRPAPMLGKRPALAQVQPPVGRAAGATNSAYPILQHPKTSVGTFPRATGGLMRRAYSVCDQPTLGEQSEEDSEFDGSPSVLAAQAEYARRHGKRVELRVDGSPNFKPMRSSIAGPTQTCGSPSRSKSSSSFANGLPGFGDNEMDGKILPCHKVKEDGLVRVTPETVNDLIGGKYTDKIKRYHIIDCRFGYEFEGGHIDGALNVKSMDALDQLLLSEASGVHAEGAQLPIPSRSGELGDGEQVVLVFHCEFSAKRAPTFAKHLRSRDRSINIASYPKIYYPEVYILEGGYCGFYKSIPQRCEPCSYTPMDDPKHFERRDSDLHNFRTFGRTKSYTFGESSNGNGGAGPACPPMAFAAASAAVGRRGNHAAGTITEEEDHETTSPATAAAEADTSAEFDDSDNNSPCPGTRAVSMGHKQGPLFGSAKPRALGRLAFQRNASYAATGLSR